MTACAENKDYASLKELQNSNKRIATLESRIEEAESRLDKMSIKMIQLVAQQANASELLTKIQYEQDREALYIELAEHDQALGELVKEMDQVYYLLNSLKRGKW